MPMSAKTFNPTDRPSAMATAKGSPCFIQAVHLAAGRVPLEASGGVNLERVVAIAATGVDYISVGALTHSVTALDISLAVELAG